MIHFLELLNNIPLSETLISLIFLCIFTRTSELDRLTFVATSATHQLHDLEHISNFKTFLSFDKEKDNIYLT